MRTLIDIQDDLMDDLLKEANTTVKKEAIVLVRNTFGTEASLTGYGDTLVDFSKMTYMASKDAIKLLNALYQIVTHKQD